jgi:hypothetical protein
MRWTWVVIGGVAALLVVAVVDSYRSSAGKAIESTTTSTHTLAGASTLPACTDQQPSISIELSGKAATITALASREEDPCRLAALKPTLTIKSRTGRTLVELGQPPVQFENLLLGSPQRVHFRIPEGMPGCLEGGPFLARASLGPYPARRRFSGSLIGCPSPQERDTDGARKAWIARAIPICKADANVRRPRLSPSLTALEVEAEWSSRVARSAVEPLRRLKALPVPRADRARIERMLSLMAEQVEVLRLEAASAAAGDRVRAHKLRVKSAGLTDQQDGVLARLALLWDVAPEPLWRCTITGLTDG